MKRFLIALQALLIPLMMSAQINMSVNGRAELDPDDTDARAYYALKDANDLDCAIIKVSLNNPVTNTLVLQAKGGAATVKSEKQTNGEWWFWVSPVVTNIMFSCEGYTPTDYVGVNLKGKNVYRLRLTVDAAVATVTTFTLGQSVMKLNVFPPEATVLYGKTKDCDMGSRVLTDGLFEAFLDKGTYYYRIESRFYETLTGKYEVTNDSPEVSVSLKPAFSYLSLDTNPQGAEVYVNGRFIGTTPIEKSDKIRRGQDVRIEFRKEDYYIEPVKVNVLGDGNVQKVDKVNLRPQFGWVTCVCDDPEAELVVSDATKEVARGKSGMRVKLNSGGTTYKLESVKPAHHPQAQGIKGSTIEGKDVEIKVDPPVGIYGGLQITSTPSRAKVFIDGVDTKKTTAFSKELLIGTHTVELKLDGYHLDPFVVDIKEGQTESLSKAMIKGPRYVTVQISTASESHIIMDGVALSGNFHSKDLEVGKTYFFESEPDDKSIAFRRSSVYYTPTIDDNQKVSVPGPHIIAGTLTLSTNGVSGVSVNVRGKNASRRLTAPTSTTMPVGSYYINATKPGYKDINTDVNIREGKTSNVNLNMRREIRLVDWYMDDEEDDFARHFLDTSFGIQDWEDFSLGFHYAYCKKHLGFYGQYLYTFYTEESSLTAGPVLRLTDDFKKVDWQVYAGGGWMYNTWGGEFGTRIGWHSNEFSWWDFGVGYQLYEGGMTPVFHIGLGITIYGVLLSLALVGGLAE